MYCRKCGAQLDDGSRFCSHCGSAVDTGNVGQAAPTQQNYQPQQQQYYAPPQQQNYYAPQPQQQYYASQQQDDTNICAILGFIFSFLIAIVGLILSIIGLQKPQFQGLAVAGIIISVVSMILAFIIIVTL